MPVPAGVGIIPWFLIVPDFHHAEHSTHLDRAEWSITGHHGNGVVRDGHFHFSHISHSTFAHYHVVRDEFGNFSGQFSMINPDERRNVMAHRVHRMVTFVAMYCPIAWLVGYKLDLSHLADRDICGHFVKP